MPPKAIAVPLKFQREGIKYNDLSPEEQEEYELEEAFYDKESGELIEEIGSSALNKWLFNIDMAEYRKRVQRFINEHKDHITIRRLRNNKPISRADVKALEEILFAEDCAISREAYEALYGDTPLGILVRSIVGLHRKAAKEVFAEFLSGAPLHPDQMTFLDEIVDYLVKNGTMEPKAVFDTPFTHINDQGIVGVILSHLATWHVPTV